MVRIPKSTSARKKSNPNRLNPDGSITVNDETFRVGDTFIHLCIRKPGTGWGMQFRNAKIVSIQPVDDEKTRVSVEGTSDWLHAEAVCDLKDIV